MLDVWRSIIEIHTYTQQTTLCTPVLASILCTGHMFIDCPCRNQRPCPVLPLTEWHLPLQVSMRPCRASSYMPFDARSPACRHPLNRVWYKSVLLFSTRHTGESRIEDVAADQIVSVYVWVCVCVPINPFVGMGCAHQSSPFSCLGLRGTR